MSCVIVVTPLVVAGWPVISAAVTAAVASMGFNIIQSGAALTKEEATVVHPEHGPIKLPKGNYRVWKQREFADEKPRPVRD